MKGNYEYKNKIHGSDHLIRTHFSLSGCGKNNAGSSPVEQVTSTTGPVEVTSCGCKVKVEKTPEKILVVHPTMTETLIAIGATDQIAGEVWSKGGEVSDKYATEAKNINSIAQGMPSLEQVTELNPDLIVASAEFWFDGERLQTIEKFNEQGIPVYINSDACMGSQEGKLENSWTDIENLGKLTGHVDNAEKVIKEYREVIEKAAAKIDLKTRKSAALLQFYEGDTFAMVRGLYSDVLANAGLDNVFESEVPADSQYSKISSESILTKNPDVILINYTEPNTLDKVIEDTKKHLLAQTR